MTIKNRPPALFFTEIRTRNVFFYMALTNLQVGLFAKLSLWSFSVINASFISIDSIRSSMFNTLVIDLASLLMSLICLI